MTPSQCVTEEQRREWITVRAQAWFEWRKVYGKPGDELSDWLQAEREFEQWRQSH